MISKENFKKINDYLWEIPKSFRSDMRVPARAYVSEKMLEESFKDRSLEQLVNVATLPGIQKYALAMPDMHEGYASCIGGVAAIKISEGIISPGMCGYDINCLCPQTRILLGNGAYTTIKELEESWKTQRVGCVDFKKRNLDASEMIYFLKRYNNPSIYQITTQSGEEVKATDDHPIQTKEGMKKVKLLSKNDYVLVYPFKGVKYQKSFSEIILTEEDYIKTLAKLGIISRGNALSQILNQIRSRQILPLRFDSPQLSIILKLIGFILGDGYISITKSKNAIVGFNGKEENLEVIREDVKKIGFNPYPIFKRTRKHKIKTHYRKYEFETLENSFRMGSLGFATFLIALGVPYGLKTFKEYRVPKWIFACPLWQKRLFLASFFGAELSTPSTLNKYNFYAPQLNMKKAEGLEKNAKLFLKDIAKLLKDFGIATYGIKEVPGYQYEGKKGRTVGFRLQIKERADNLIRFFETIGYEYNQKKQTESCLAVSYLKTKLRIVDLRAKARREIRSLYKKKGDFKKLVEKYSSEYTSPQFLYKSLFEEDVWGVRKKRGNPRIAFNFPSFKEYKKKYAYGNQGLAWEKIEKIERLPYQDFVYDFTILNENHNFIANNFVVSNCGMKLLKSEYSEKEIKPHLEKLVTEMQKEVPSGLGRGRQIKLSVKQIDRILEEGAKHLVENGYGEEEDIKNCEAGGKLEWADASTVSNHAKDRGRDQVGTLGSGNHFMELQKVEEIFDEEVAKIFGLFKDQIIVMIHCGSRGLGHQICTDYLKTMIPAIGKYRIKVPDREFACVPFNSSEGQRYFKAMAAGANYAWANRQMIAHYVRKAWKSVLGLSISSGLVALYDVAHNIIKKEKYLIDGKETEVAVHRKGATRAFPPNHPEVPEKYRLAGQPVLIPGSMGTASYVLVGTEQGKDSWYSTCHGAGRTMSRHAATRALSGQEVINQLKAKGILVKCYSMRGIAEESPQAYKNIDEVVEVVHRAGLSKKVARLVPLAVIKGE